MENPPHLTPRPGALVGSTSQAVEAAADWCTASCSLIQSQMVRVWLDTGSTAGPKLVAFAILSSLPISPLPLPCPEPAFPLLLLHLLQTCQASAPLSKGPACHVTDWGVGRMCQDASGGRWFSVCPSLDNFPTLHQGAKPGPGSLPRRASASTAETLGLFRQEPPCLPGGRCYS